MLVPWWHWLGAACFGWGVHLFSVLAEGEAIGGVVGCRARFE